MQHADDMNTVEEWGTLLPEDTYTVRIDTVQEATSKAGNPIVNISMVIQDEPYVGRKIFDMISLQPNALAKLKAYYTATGTGFVAGQPGHDPETLVGAELKIVLKQQPAKDGYPARNTVPPYGPKSLFV